MSPNSPDFSSALTSYLKEGNRTALSTILQVHKSNQSLQEDAIAQSLLEASIAQALHHAIVHNYPSDVETILDAGISATIPLPTNDRRDYIYTPLLCASKHGRRDIARLLWARGGLEFHFVSDDPTDPYRHHSCIELAARNGHVDLVRDFLQHPWMEEDLGYALVGAVEGWHDDVVALLLGGREVPVRDMGRVMWAVMGGTCSREDVDRQYRTVCLLIDALGDERSEEWQGRIFSATSGGRLGVLRALLDRAGVDPNFRNVSGMTALHQYKRSAGGVPDDIATVRLLLEYGADPELGDERGETPVHSIALHGTLEELRLHLGYVRDVDAALGLCNDDGESVLHYAAVGKETEVVEFLLLQRGLDVNAVSKNGWTPLVCALMPSRLKLLSDAVDMANVLLQHGAKADTVTDENWTPMHALASWPPSGPNPPTWPTGLAIWPGDGAGVILLVGELIARGARLDACAPVLRNKYFNASTVCAMWGARLRELAKMQAMGTTQEVREEDTAPHMWADRTGRREVFEAILDHWTKGKETTE
ncbi:hypothetical protein OQA88_7484 [Cercophora sp. LCS_1]